MYLPLDEKFTWIPRETIIENERIGGKLESSSVIIIGLRNNLTNLILPHPISNFIIQNYKNKQKSTSTQLRAARIICMFLNFIYSKIEDEAGDFVALQTKGIRGLRLMHGAKFITHGTYLGNNSDTIAYWETTLTRFFYFLKEQDLIEEDPKIRTEVNRQGKEILLSPFGSSVFDIERPNKDKDSEMATLKDFGDNRYDLVKIFIDIAKVHAEDIALGIYFQFFGGLRVGEVVNLTESALQPKGYRGENRRSFFVDVEDRQEKLFRHLKNNQYNQVKRSRIQFIIYTDLLKNLYENHIKNIEIFKRKNMVKIEDSLFISHKTGIPISAPNYTSRFNRVKKLFLEELRNKRYYEDVEFLESLPWSTHIGRAVFTNFLIDKGLEAEEIRDARGDKSIMSAIPYIERRVVKEKIKNVMNKVSEKYGNENKGIQHRFKREEKIRLYDKVMSNWSLE